MSKSKLTRRERKIRKKEKRLERIMDRIKSTKREYLNEDGIVIALPEIELNSTSNFRFVEVSYE